MKLRDKRRACLRRLCLGAFFGITLGAAASASVSPQVAGAGIYLKGSLPSGKPLAGHREKNSVVQGAEAACTNCHRRSGLGSKEGRIKIPPIAGDYLFKGHGATADDFELRVVETLRNHRKTYDASSFARALREGIDSEGRPMSYLMPRYDLKADEIADLTSYLKSLSTGRVPGVEDTALHFATIVTPDADPRRRQSVLGVLEEFFKGKNAATASVSPTLMSSQKMMYKVNRHWQLHVWELKGPEDTWEQQLREWMKKAPVYAVISGIGGKNWAPVQHFCDAEAVPCLFPNVDAPATAGENNYSVYFSDGVLLEAALIAHDIKGKPADLGIRRVVQVFRANDAGAEAAEVLAKDVAAKNLPVLMSSLPAEAQAADLNALLGSVHAGDALVLWLRPDDLKAIGTAPAASLAYASSVMGGADDPPLPADWKGAIRLAYPFDVPLKRRVSVDYALGWFRFRHIPIIDQRLQADTFLACGLLSETLSHMVDAFYRDYLIERLEETVGKRIVTGYYRRLSLGPGQRLASKGGYIVRYDPKSPGRWIADSEWIVP